MNAWRISLALTLASFGLTALAGEGDATQFPAGPPGSPQPFDPDAALRRPKREDCKNEKFQAILSLAAVPRAISAILTENEPVAEFGHPFNSTDAVVGTERLPFRRFAFGAVGEHRAYVAVEHGGIGYNVEIWSFNSDGTGWQGSERWFGMPLPTSLGALLFLTCDIGRLDKGSGRGWFRGET